MLVEGIKAARAVRRVADRLENTGLRGSDGKPRDADTSRPFMPFEGCCICWKDEDKPRILLCDNCDDEYHLYCLDPPLEEIPEGSTLIFDSFPDLSCLNPCDNFNWSNAPQPKPSGSSWCSLLNQRQCRNPWPQIPSLGFV